MRGRGPRWRAIEQLFDVHVRRLGLEPREIANPEPVRVVPLARAAPPSGELPAASDETSKPRQKRQLTLF